MDIPPAPYDINFCFPIPENLESERVVLTPFIPSKHAQLFLDQAILYPQIFNYLPFGPFKDVDDLVSNLIETRIRRDPGYTLFVIYDKTKPAHSFDHPGAFAGLIGFLNSSAPNLLTEIGFVIILPPFQRSHVTSNAVGILLNFALNLPSQQPGALGLRRVVWQANALNKASVRAAERMGFKFEGILRWERVLPASKSAVGAGNGKDIRDGDPRRDCVGRDTARLSLCWDDWEGGAREQVNKIMRRTQ
ncbi:hypothetical protein M413DRAFT_443174 [Hebeloma cylindrosporum]|uniref:N-acetyltransferase domain-containing protein n=1 Tax=Hebeloma cylindrosporum TaxID=76867 RepID=A0A0C3C5M1_HEBCY|nr:hypothetical protein M413DRAFT_443174 [Hebeloma cylindrosporum h7]